MIFQPQRSSYEDTSQIIKLTTSDGVQISAIYLPNPQARYTILYSHGNAEDLGDLLWVFTELREMGFAVFGYDYHGYGTSQGSPTERNVYRDIDAAYNYLTEQLGIPPQQIIAYGRSVGSGPAVDLATRQKVGGLILESPFLTAFRVLTRIPIVPFDKFRNIDKIKRVHCPVLVMHGKRDEVVPFSNGKKLFEAANEPKRFLWVDAATHNDLMEVADDQYAKALREFAQ
ncbi:MAG: alpha/beta hydrolase [Aphanothece sp. CMT-3BRIN-NPC111]|nr:alpha/beta hydrolase [Aphanothece sp. CMT-3BRIN-NPC111]